MKESVLHFIWQYKLFNSPFDALKTTDGEEVEVIDIGRYNSDSGPDFFNAKIKIAGTVWAGNVEFHQRSSDWKRHQHQLTKAYDNVILHIVEKVDADVFRTNGEKIPQMVFRNLADLQSRYDDLLKNITWIPCENKIHQIEVFQLQAWKNYLLTERLEQKTTAVANVLEAFENNWEEAFYVLLARSFGFGVNNQPFEQLAKSLPLAVIAKHKDNLFQLEALLFGQAGLLNVEMVDLYLNQLQKEYHFLQIKYNLKSMEQSLWKLLRLRPDNFPHIRLAQFAQLIFTSSKLFSKILEQKNIQQLRQLFVCEVSDYWKNHYLFGKMSKPSIKRMGNNSIDILLINTVIPFLFAYGTKKGDQNLVERALDYMEKIPAEKNSVVLKWNQLGVVAANAFDSQALLQLKKNYCDEKKCLRCRIGHQILTLK